MTTLKVFKANIQTPPTIRVFKANVSGSASATPKFRIFKASVSGTVNIALNNVRTQSNVEPGVTVTFSATLAQGPSSGLTYTWVQVSGPTVSLTPSGATVTLSAPSVMPTDTTQVVLGVTATDGTNTSPQVTAVLNVLPQTQWTWNGTAWIGSKPINL